MLKALFLDHPDSVGETYLEHQGVAFAFAGELLGAGLACVVHGLVPGLFTRTASRAVGRLHERLVVNRQARPHELTPSKPQAA